MLVEHYKKGNQVKGCSVDYVLRLALIDVNAQLSGSLPALVILILCTLFDWYLPDSGWFNPSGVINDNNDNIDNNDNNDNIDNMDNNDNKILSLPFPFPIPGKWQRVRNVGGNADGGKHLHWEAEVQNTKPTNRHFDKFKASTRHFCAFDAVSQFVVVPGKIVGV